jgi:L-alanine-DL-glutamate epimerase-like enolase superfamily enzyme
MNVAGASRFAHTTEWSHSHAWKEVGVGMASTKFGDTGVAIEQLEVSVYTVPTDSPESDGTYVWDKTTMVLVEASAGGKRGLGYTYADLSTATLIKTMLADIVQGHDAMNVPGCWLAMVESIRNLGRPGIASMAIAAVDIALWDLKARLLDLSLVTLLGATREAAPIYGSGGFTSYSREQLQKQLGDWAAAGIPRVKMKIGRHPDRDPLRVREAREAIGPDTELYVDANGAYTRKDALALADIFAAESGVTWFEEPVSSDDLDGLRLIRDRAPAGMDIAAGEYGYDLWYFRRMLEAGAVDVLQADATRCAGITGFMRVAPLCEVRSMQLSSHCGPSLHVHPCCAVPNFRHMEYFHDHVRIERMFFDGVLTPVHGELRPDLSRPGMGLEFKRSDTAKYAV